MFLKKSQYVAGKNFSTTPLQSERVFFFSLFGILPQNPLLHLQWNISASLTWHVPLFLHGLGRQGLLPHSPTPLPYRLSPPCSCRFSTRLLTSSKRMQPTRPVATPVLSITLKRERNLVRMLFSFTITVTVIYSHMHLGKQIL